MVTLSHLAAPVMRNLGYEAASSAQGSYFVEGRQILHLENVCHLGERKYHTCDLGFLISILESDGMSKPDKISILKTILVDVL